MRLPPQSLARSASRNRLTTGSTTLFRSHQAPVTSSKAGSVTSCSSLRGITSLSSVGARYSGAGSQVKLKAGLGRLDTRTPLPLTAARWFQVSAAQFARTVKVPDMAESITEGTLKRWNKQPGEKVNQDEEVATIETDKIDVSVNAPASGTISNHLAKEEDTVKVGQDLFELEEGEGNGAAAEGAQESASGQKEQEQEGGQDTSEPVEQKSSPPSSSGGGGQTRTVKVPDMAESITEGTLKRFNKSVGDRVEADEEVATIETDKIDVSVNAPEAGVITEFLANTEETVKVGQELFLLQPGGEANAPSPPPSQKKPEPPKKEQPPPKQTQPKSRRQFARPELQSREDEPSRPAPKRSDPRFPEAEADARRKEKERQEEEGTGVKRETREDPDVKETRAGGATSGPERIERRVKMNRMRIRIAERLKQSQNAAASLTTFNEIDMSALMALRKRHKDKILKEHNVKLGFMSAFAHASCMALKEIPAANASIEGPGAGEQIVYRDYVDLSVAVATPKGLVTPVVRNAESMNFLEIEQAIAELGKKARDGKLTLEDMAGGTFTISNGGVFGSLYGTPIINLPQAAVLGMHTIKDRAVVENGQVVVRPIMVVALTYDHRLLDGREAVTFLVRIKQYLEDPASMLLSYGS